MADAVIDQDQFTDDQRTALATYTAVTNQDHAAAVALLARSQWNVQIAIAKFFDGEGPDLIEEARAAQAAPPASAALPRHETLLNGFTATPQPRAAPQNSPAPRVVPQPRDQGNFLPPTILLYLLKPFNFAVGLVGNTISLLGYLLSFVPKIFPAIFVRRPAPRIRSGRRPLSPRDTAARFAREFEEDYGQHDLAFFDGGYATAYDIAKKELKFLLVILLSPEHDDTPIFVRDVLLSSEVTTFIKGRSELLLWAGNVQDSEAYQVSSALNCSKFPFAALVAQVNSTAMATIARISGLTTPSTFVAQLRRAIEQHESHLSQVRNQRNEQQASRNLRDEQNTAYERSLAQDRERARQRREAEAAEARAAAEASAQADARARASQMREEWRRWRAQILSPEPEEDVKDIHRLSFRLPSGERVVRRFHTTAKMEELYAFVECKDYLLSGEGTTTVKPQDYSHTYGFRLLTSPPRTEYDPEAQGTLGQTIDKRVNFVVEPIDDEDDDEHN